MPVIVVTRLRLRDPALLDEFFTDAVAAIEQAMKSEGNLGADALADANNAWWSVSAWQERGLMRAYVDSEPHLSIRARLDHYCDEATFVDWEQPSADLPDWQTSWRHLTADGQAAELTHATAANQSLDFPPPVEPPSTVTLSGHVIRGGSLVVRAVVARKTQPPPPGEIPGGGGWWRRPAKGADIGAVWPAGC